MVAHAERAHALLSASGASRWLSCPGSSRLEEDLPDSTSTFAEEGTLAHELCDISLKLHFKEIKKTEYNKQLKKIKANELYAEEMLSCAEDYVAYVASLTNRESIVWIETRLDFSEYVPEGFGTGDGLVITDNELHIIDYKHGKGIAVSANDNSQMKLYALGAISMLSMVYDFDKVTMHIFQPRLNNVDSFTLEVDELINWGENVVKPTAKLAYEGNGHFNAGEHCKFCKIKPTCKTLLDYTNECIASEFEDETGELSVNCITPNDIEMIINRTKVIKNWLSEVENYALNGIMNGTVELANYKVVEGRSNRAYKNADAVVDKLKANGFDESLLYEKKVLTITAMEKVVGKKQFAELLGDLIEKPPGKPTLVPLSDKREAISLVNEFEIEEEDFESFDIEYEMFEEKMLID